MVVKFSAPQKVKLKPLVAAAISRTTAVYNCKTGNEAFAVGKREAGICGFREALAALA